MSTKGLKMRKHQHRQQYLLKVLERYMSEKALKEFDEEYTSHLHKNHGRAPTKTDMKVYADYKSGMTNAELTKKYGKSYSFILGAVYRAARNS